MCMCLRVCVCVCMHVSEGGKSAHECLCSVNCVQGVHMRPEVSLTSPQHTLPRSAALTFSSFTERGQTPFMSPPVTTH